MVNEEAYNLLAIMRLVQIAVEEDDPSAKPFLDADAVRRDPSAPGGCVFHKDRFLKVLGEVAELERMRGENAFS